jgi:hypothetical protein
VAVSVCLRGELQAEQVEGAALGAGGCQEARRSGAGRRMRYPMPYREQREAQRHEKRREKTHPLVPYPIPDTLLVGLALRVADGTHIPVVCDDRAIAGQYDRRIAVIGGGDPLQYAFVDVDRPQPRRRLLRVLHEPGGRIGRIDMGGDLARLIAIVSREAAAGIVHRAGGHGGPANFIHCLRHEYHPGGPLSAYALLYF